MRTAALVLAALAAGCAGDLDDRPARLGYIAAAIFVPSCATASCHSAAVEVAGLAFDETPARLRQVLID